LGKQLTYIDEIELLAILSIVEIGLGIIAGPLCTLRPLLRKAKERFGLTTVKTNRSIASKTNQSNANASGTNRSTTDRSQKGSSILNSHIDDVEKRTSLTPPRSTLSPNAPRTHPDFLVNIDDDFDDEDIEGSTEHINMPTWSNSSTTEIGTAR
jgi:hypothetical protein